MADDPFSPWASDPDPVQAPSASSKPLHHTSTSPKSAPKSESHNDPTSPTAASAPTSKLFDDGLFDADAAWGTEEKSSGQSDDDKDKGQEKKEDGLGGNQLTEDIWAGADAEEGQLEDGNGDLSAASGAAVEKGEQEQGQGHKDEGETQAQASVAEGDVGETSAEKPQDQYTKPTATVAEVQDGAGDVEEEEEEEEFGDAVESNTPPMAEGVEAPTAAPIADSTAPTLPTPSATTEIDDDFGDFDDEPVVGGATNGQGSGALGEDDDFGDFDDGFGEDDEVVADDAKAPVMKAANGNGIGQPSVVSPALAAPAIADWKLLSIPPGSTSDSLSSSIRDILSAPLQLGNGAETGSYPFHDDAAKRLGKSAIRDVQGVGQVLVSEECRQLWGRLSALPPTRPIEWQRSRTRRDHLISLGVPVNLEEFTTSTSKPVLPPLSIDVGGGAGGTKGGSDKLASASSISGAAGGGGSSSARDANGYAARAGARGDAGAFAGTLADARAGGAGSRGREERLGPKPECDTKRAGEIVEMSEDTLLLQSLPALRSISKEVQNLTISVSMLLTYRLQQREALQADNETYNGLIKDLVAGAANRFGGSTTAGERRSVVGGKRTSTPMGRVASGMNGGKGQSPSGSRPASPFTLAGGRR